MKIFTLIDPLDYTDANVYLFTTREKAEDEKEAIAKEFPYKRQYLRIQEDDLQE